MINNKLKLTAFAALTLFAVNSNAGLIDIDGNFNVKHHHKLHETNPLVDYVVSDRFQHPQSSIVVLAKRVQHKDGDVIGKVSVFNGKTELWSGDGLFSEVVYSENGEAILLVRKYPSKLESVIIHNGKVNIFTQKYAKASIPEFNEQLTFHQISNNAKQILSYELYDGSISNLLICTLVNQESPCDKLPVNKMDNSWEVDAVISAENEVYLLKSNELLKIFNNTIHWQIKLDDDFDYLGQTYEKLSLYKNLVIISYSEKVKVFDKDSGTLLWEMGRKVDDEAFGSLYHIYVDNDKLVLPLREKGQTAHKDLVPFIQ
ncbi:hypothetical protein [Psychrobium sp. 1_MG-2023]|uniref:hypothetical protein n=1 Tax=Psychrobium sp. 1_MG-2023 TaxID=3062624 RepID=UPI000C342310|nr:hypothetical protein [Psychrobium sp. 1_MG-2023]MDP2562919.1 hypothetical protein [Psychrobium sp. 1_MG-2023]PKF53752.1 hypothetical protein CW748_17680 [Alteromonadales bacterium alter-6D02]